MKVKISKKLFLLKYFIDLEKMHENRVTALINESFLLKLIFHQNFLFEKKEKMLTKHFCQHI